MKFMKNSGPIWFPEAGENGTYFAVWAPNAASVSVVGDFNGWNVEKHPMKLAEASDIYELFVPGVGKGSFYKYAIKTETGEILYKADPYGNLCQVRPENASVVADMDGYSWSDRQWEEKKKPHETNQPMAVYEVHLGSWKKVLTEPITAFSDIASSPMNWPNM